MTEKCLLIWNLLIVKSNEIEKLFILNALM